MRGRSVRPLAFKTIHGLLDRAPVNPYDLMAANDREYREAEEKAGASWGQIAVSAIAALALIIFTMALDGGFVR